jgi:hypothetical protein
MKTPSRPLIVFCVAAYAVLVALILAASLVKTQGHFVYALDDPYIHLALAENLAHGHYGINPGEPSSPSSSILWPFLLIPFAGTSLHVFLPLALNLLFGVMAAALIGAIVAKWPLDKKPGPTWLHYLTCLLFLFIANLASLTVIGMEHVLQLLIALACAHAVLQAVNDRPIPTWCLIAAALGPMVRYELLALSLAVAITLIGVKRWRAAGTVFGLSIVPPIAFAVFLKSRGLPPLPLSVLVKGNAFTSQSAVLKATLLVKEHLYQDIIHPAQYSTIAFTLAAAVLASQARTRPSKCALWATALVGALQLTIGNFGWLHRYEVYALTFLAIVVCGTIASLHRLRCILLLPVLALTASFYIIATIDTPTAVDAVYAQQYQMRRFTTQFYSGSYAANDIGLLSFQRRPGAYMLDVYGLASLEAAQQSVRTAPWLAGIVQRHDIDLAILYPQWFEIPSTWKPIGKMCDRHRGHLLLGNACVIFYSTNPRSDAIIRDNLTRFAATLPYKAIYTSLN